jgi:nitroimidazol reductase NimA-like FMN-containing flavoprotein (pyridoxamine 5'-phosphate oxidase superfamily)
LIFLNLLILELTIEELNFINKNECCRLATCSRNKPHVVPVSYIFSKGFFYIATDYKTKKLFNIKNNPYVSIVIDIYKPFNNKGIVINGNVELVENGKSFHDIYDLFFNKFEWVRISPWIEGEAPFLKIIPKSKAVWGFEKHG